MKWLAEEVQKRREMPESKNLSEKEILKQSIEAVPPAAAAVPPAAAAAPPAPAPEPSGPLPQYAKSASPEVKLEIEYLLDLAFHKGIANSEAEARKSSPFVLDAFHDALAGKLYPELQRRGILK